MAADNDSYELFESTPESKASGAAAFAPVAAVTSDGGEKVGGDDDNGGTTDARKTLYHARHLPGVEEITPGDVEISDVKGEYSFGKYLRELRERNHFTIDEIVETTQIGRGYVEALEREDFDHLPPLAYVLAYVKKLCSLYKVPPERTREVTAELRELLKPEAPDDINKSVVDREESEENIRRLRQLTVILGAAALLVVVVIVVVGVLIWAGLRRGDSVEFTGPAFDQLRLVELQGKPAIEPTKLKPRE